MKKYLKIISAALFITAAAAVSGSAVDKAKEYKIGDRGPAGGWIFFDRGADIKPDDEVQWRYLEAAPEDQSDEAAWNDGDSVATGAKGTAVGAGSMNSAKIIKLLGKNAKAAKICSEYKGGNTSGWYLPSKNELNLMYENLKKNGTGGFADMEYWSSSESDEAYAWYQDFKDGAADSNTKTNRLRVRAVRAFKAE